MVQIRANESTKEITKNTIGHTSVFQLSEQAFEVIYQDKTLCFTRWASRFATAALNRCPAELTNGHTFVQLAVLCIKSKPPPIFWLEIRWHAVERLCVCRAWFWYCVYLTGNARVTDESHESHVRLNKVERLSQDFTSVWGASNSRADSSDWLITL